MNSKELHDLATDPKGRLVDFSNIAEIKFLTKNIEGATLTGLITQHHIFNGSNIIHSVLQGVEARTANFDSSDIKDSVFREGTFEKCNFDNASHINNSFQGVKLIECSFVYSSLNDSEFKDVNFIECDFTNVVISSCRFERCTFLKCKTTNKMIESSLIFDCVFEKTTLQVETIVENFGITKDSLTNGSLSVSSLKSRKVLPSLEIGNDVIRSFTTIEKFAWGYFIDPNILVNGSEDVDLTFIFQKWIEISKNPNRFRLLIERYHEFIMYNYENNKAPLWLVLKFHAMTNELSQKIDPGHVEVYRAIMGIHMSLARLVEDFLRVLEFLMHKFIEEGRLILLVNGPIDEGYYYHAIPEIFQDSSTRIEKVIKHNSPNELHLVWEKVQDLLPILTIFLATRLKLGIQRLIPISSASESYLPANLEKSSIDGIYGIDLVRTELGFDKAVNNYMFKLRAILPGNLLIDLRIDLRTEIFGKIKSIILDFIPKS